MEVNLTYGIAILLVLLAIYHYLTRRNRYFENYPIPCLPVEPLFGSFRRMVLKRVSFQDFVRSIYDQFPGVKIFGMFEMLTPLFVLRDADLVKHVMVKDFDHFINHRPMMKVDGQNSKSSVLLTKILFTLTDQRWRSVRTTLSPTFTGSKMRQMFSLIVECSGHVLEKLASRGVQELEVKDLFIRFTNDAIASCAFGVQVNSFEDDQNEFLRYGKELTNFGRLHVFFKMMGFQLAPKLMSWLQIDLFDRKHVQFFTEMFHQSVEARERHGIIRPDMVHLLMQAGKGTLRHQPDDRTEAEGFATAKESYAEQTSTVTLSEQEMVAQCVIFFVAGFDTVATLLSFLTYEIALAPEIQQQLYDEVSETNDSLDGKTLTYDALQGMRYLDMVVCETLRRWPPTPGTDRLCNQDYKVPCEEGDTPITIPKGATVSIPIVGLHYDPRYFPDPDRFDPERFNEENRQNIPLGAYLPFGVGPRNCIASRFALMEVKAIVYHLVLNYEFQRCDRTPVPMCLAKGFTTLKAEKGIYLRLVPRNKA